MREVRKLTITVTLSRTARPKRHWHLPLCFALLWQCRHKLGKIAQCLVFRVVVCVLANSVVNCSLRRFSNLQLIMVRLAGAGHIVSPRAQLVLQVKCNAHVVQSKTATR